MLGLTRFTFGSYLQVEENVLRCVRYNEGALLNGRIDHSQISLNVEKYSVTEKKKPLGGGGIFDLRFI